MFSGKLKLYKLQMARYMKGRREVCRCLFISYLITSFSEFQNSIMCKDVFDCVCKCLSVPVSEAVFLPKCACVCACF